MNLGVYFCLHYADTKLLINSQGFKGGRRGICSFLTGGRRSFFLVRGAIGRWEPIQAEIAGWRLDDEGDGNCWELFMHTRDRIARKQRRK